MRRLGSRRAGPRARERLFAGIDVGAHRLHCVVVDEALRVAAVRVVAASELDLLVGALRGVAVAAVDAPAATSALPHELDLELGAKFRSARCAEVALGREHGIWVPWIAPAVAPVAGWMAVGLRLFARLAQAGVPAIETYPYACFRLLRGGGRLPRKQTVEGRRARAELLAQAGVRGRDLALWTHDGLDALAAAATAHGAHAGTAAPVGCGHDGSAIWLPGGPVRAVRPGRGATSARAAAPRRPPRAPGLRGSRARPR